MWIFPPPNNSLRLKMEFVQLIRTDSHTICSFRSIYHWKHSIDWFCRAFHQILFEENRKYWMREVKASIQFRFCPFPNFSHAGKFRSRLAYIILSINNGKKWKCSMPAQCSMLLRDITFRFSQGDIFRTILNTSAGYCYWSKNSLRIYFSIFLSFCCCASAKQSSIVCHQKTNMCRQRFGLSLFLHQPFNYSSPLYLPFSIKMNFIRAVDAATLFSYFKIRSSVLLRNVEDVDEKKKNEFSALLQLSNCLNKSSLFLPFASFL